MWQQTGRISDPNQWNPQASEKIDLNQANKQIVGLQLPQMPYVPTYSQTKSPMRDRPINNEKTSNQNRNQSTSNSFFMTIWGRQLNGKNIPSNQTNTIQVFGTQIQQASAGEEHTMIINQKQELFSCGTNSFGQLGIPNSAYIGAPSSIPSLRNSKIRMVVCGSHHTFALSDQGEVYAWGLNLKGQLGLGHYENQSTPQLVLSLLPSTIDGKAKQNLKDTQQSSQSQLSRRIDDSYYQPNSIEDLIQKIQIMNKESQQRQSKNNVSFLESEEKVLSISCGTFHTIVTTTRGKIFSAGYGESYALGTSNTDNQTYFKPIEISGHKREIIKIVSCGITSTSCVLGDKVYVWGIVGIRQSLIYKKPTEMEFPKDTSIVDIQSGDCYILFLSQKGEVFQLCNDQSSNVGSNGMEMPIKLQKLPSMKQISVGNNYTIGLTQDQSWLYAWGSNNFGQITGSIGGKAAFPDPVKIVQISADVMEVGISCCYYMSIITAKKAINKNDFLFSQGESQQIAVESEIEVEIRDLKKMSQQESERFSKIIQEKVQEIQTLEKNNINLIKADEQNAIDLQEYKRKEKEILRQLKEVQLKNQTLIAQYEGRPAAARTPTKAQNDNQKFMIQGNERFKNVNFRKFHSNLEIDFNELVLEQKISEGGYGIIHKAKWRETTVAVKKFKVVNDESTVKDFLSECHAMEAMRHPNIVMFIGACTQAPNFCIILEYCQKGSLWSLLQSDIKLSWEDRKKIALDIARGVFYLHSSNPPILHRDLKSLNLLLDDSYRCKLADFGWTKTLTEDNYMTAKIGTYQWMAPEVISSNFYSEKADVFSFGIILWEIASREPPFRNKSGNQVSVEVLQNRLRPTIPKNCPLQFADLMQRCWETDPAVRPSFKDIIRELEKINFTKTV